MGLVGVESFRTDELLRGAAREGASAAETSANANIIGVLGVTYNTDNYGVRVLLSGLVQSLARAIKSPRFRLVDYGPEPVLWREQTGGGQHDLQLVNLRFSWRLHLPNNIARLLVLAWLSRLLPATYRRHLLNRNPWLREILSAKVHLSMTGGDSFSDIYGLRRFFYVVLPQLLVLALDRPLVLLPQTYGPFNSWIARTVARFVFRRATLIYSRDSKGIATVQHILGTKDAKVRRSPDLGFTMEPEPVEETVSEQMDELRQAGPVVGLNVSSLLYMGGYSGNNMFQLREDYPALVNNIMEMLLNELGARIVLVPHIYGDSESEECEVKLLRRLTPGWQEKYPGRVVFFDRVFNHRQIKSLIGQCDFFIGSRMHACIGAASQCVPTVGLAYSSKFAGVMDSEETGTQVADLRFARTAEVLGTVRGAFLSRQQSKQRLERIVPNLKAAARGVFCSEDFQVLFAGKKGSCP